MDVDPQRNCQDAPRASAATCPQQRQRRRFHSVFAGRSTRQRCHPPKTATRPSIQKTILRTLHELALPPAENSEAVVDSKQSSQDAPHASAATRPKQQDGRRFRTEFSGRSKRLRPREDRRLRKEFAERSTRQRCHPRKTAREKREKQRP